MEGYGNLPWLRAAAEQRRPGIDGCLAAAWHWWLHRLARVGQSDSHLGGGPAITHLAHGACPFPAQLLEAGAELTMQIPGWRSCSAITAIPTRPNLSRPVSLLQGSQLGRKVVHSRGRIRRREPAGNVDASVRCWFMGLAARRQRAFRGNSIRSRITGRQPPSWSVAQTRTVSLQNLLSERIDFRDRELGALGAYKQPRHGMCSIRWSCVASSWSV
jgi:hypothetical protein